MKRAPLTTIGAALTTAVVCGLLTPAPALSDTTSENPDRSIVRESFDTQTHDRGFTHEAPEGWSVTNDESMTDVGVDDWRGWSFTTREHWVGAEDQMRHRFARAQDIIAVADSDEFADTPGGHTFDSTLTSSEVDVAGLDAVDLSFDSHYRSWTDQVATVTVSFDGGEAHEILRLDENTVEHNYDMSRVNAREHVTVQVPDGAKTAQLSWRFQSDANSWYWAIDSVNVSETLPEATGNTTSAWVISDIQGHPADMSHGLEDLHGVRPDASGLLIAGDITDTGAAGEWQEIHDVMDERADIRPEQTLSAIGNHESYSAEPWETQLQRFLDFAERNQVWGEYVLEGAGPDVPVLVLGQEEQRPPEVPMSEEQITWFEEWLDYWSEQGSQVLVMTHFPLGDTVSASWLPWYHDHHQHNDRLTEILGNHPNAVVFTGHTHYPAELGDWAVQRRTADGHPDGFWAVNTLAMHNEWDARGENTEDIAEIVTRDINQGLTVDAYADRLVVTARDFGAVSEQGADNDTNDVLRTVTIPNTIGTNGSGAGGGEGPAEGDIPVEAEIPGLPGDGDENDEPGSLVLSVSDGSATLNNQRNAGDRLRMTGEMPSVTVTDTRIQANGWSVAGQSSDLTTGNSTVTADHLGWAPNVDDDAQNPIPGETVNGVLRGGDGLATPATLGEASTDNRLGSTELAADLNLEVPVDTVAGNYQGALSISLFPVD